MSNRQTHVKNLIKSNFIEFKIMFKYENYAKTIQTDGLV